jgi:hypothetical protein
MLYKIIFHQYLMKELPISFNIRAAPRLRATPSIPTRLLLLLFVLLLLQQSLASTAAPPLLVG